MKKIIIPLMAIILGVGTASFKAPSKAPAKKGISVLWFTYCDGAIIPIEQNTWFDQWLDISFFPNPYGCPSTTDHFNGVCAEAYAGSDVTSQFGIYLPNPGAVPVAVQYNYFLRDGCYVRGNFPRIW